MLIFPVLHALKILAYYYHSRCILSLYGRKLYFITLLIRIDYQKSMKVIYSRFKHVLCWSSISVLLWENTHYTFIFSIHSHSFLPVWSGATRSPVCFSSPVGHGLPDIYESEQPSSKYGTDRSYHETGKIPFFVIIAYNKNIEINVVQQINYVLNFFKKNNLHSLPISR